jgi:hypothetical protein
MIVILASRYDKTAEWLATRWAAAGADGCVLTCEDLSVSGWQYRPSQPLAGTAVVGGREVATNAIRGVLTHLPHVSDLELIHIDPPDRAYVAAEMTAFLTVWLSDLPCRVLNRPSPGCLTGPSFIAEQWVAAASKLGMRIRPTRTRLGLNRSHEIEREAPVARVTVIGSRCFGEVDEVLRRRASQLACTMGVDMLGVHFSGSEPDALFVGVSTSPDISTPDVADAILDYFTTLTDQTDKPLGSGGRRWPHQLAGQSLPDSR